jgi:hypothetical protein
MEIKIIFEVKSWVLPKMGKHGGGKKVGRTKWKG